MKRTNTRAELDAWMIDVTQFPVLTHAEMQELAQLIKDGDQEAFHLMVVSNMRLVVNIVEKKFYDIQTSLSKMDLIQEGNIGLIKAVQGYNISFGTRFSTYATFRIMHSIYEALSAAQYVKLTKREAHAKRFITKLQSKLRQQLAHEPTDEELEEAITQLL